MAARKAKAKAIAVPVPQSAAEADMMIADIGSAQRMLAAIQTKMTADLAAIKQAAEERAAPLHAAIKERRAGLEIWATANRAALTDGGRTKTITLSAGELKWRLTPPRAAITNAKHVLGRLKALCLTRFIRVTEEIDKEALLREPEAAAQIEGVAILQDEEFVVEPFAPSLSTPLPLELVP